MNKKLLLVLVLALYTLAGYAKQRTESEALSIARSFYERTSKLKAGVPLTLAYAGKDATATRSAGNNAHYYLFNKGGDGFVIVSGDDRAKEILGYSDEGVFDYAVAPDNFKYWLDFFAEEIKSLSGQPETASSKPSQLLKATHSFAASISPLLGNIKWNQGDPYNQQCPVDPTTDQRSVTGCVATAMAQIMRYHGWPAQGVGSTSYTTGKRSISVSADFNTTYDWANMTPTYGSSSVQTEKDAVAKLMFHCGASVMMDYASNESGAASANVMVALRTYFDYDTGIANALRDFYSASNWKSLLKTELNAGRPALYSGSSSGGGHAFVCDGYDSNDLFHMNWGWGGSANGYFELSALNPGSLGIGGGSGGYNTGQEALIGIRPNTGESTALVAELGYESFTVSTATINNIATETYSLTVRNVRNTGTKPFVGLFGMGLYNASGQIKGNYLYTTGDTPLSFGAYYPELPINNLSLNGLPEGEYTLRMITVENLSDDSPSVKYMRSKEGTNDYIKVTISGSTATFSVPTAGLPGLSGATPSLIGAWYRNRTGRLTIDVTNNGTGEYNSNMAVVLLPSSGGGTPQANGTLLCNDPVVAAIGETVTIGFSGMVSVAPGSYNLYVLYDPNNFRDDFDVATSSILATTPVTINAEPSAPDLKLKSYSFPDAEAIYASNVEYRANIENTGGYFDGSFIVYVTEEGQVSVIATFGEQEAIIAPDETKELTFKGSLDLEQGNFQTWLFYKAGNIGWTQLDFGKSFTILPNTGTGIEPTVTDVDPVVATKYFDLLGKEVKQPQKGNIYIIKQTHKSQKVSVKKILGN